MLLSNSSAFARSQSDRESQPKGIVLVQLGVQIAAFLFLAWVVLRGAPYAWHAGRFAVLGSIFLWECLIEECRNFRADFLDLAWSKRLIVLALAVGGSWTGSYFLRAAARVVLFGS